MRPFPLIPRLKSLFIFSKIADSLRWHDKESTKNLNVRHPTDGLAFNDFDRLHTDFALDYRIVRLLMSSDGFNPFRTMSILHSTWTISLMVHNLPLCILMKY